MKRALLIFSCLVFIMGNKETFAKPYVSCFGKESTKWVIIKPTSWWGIESTQIPYYHKNDTLTYFGFFEEDSFTKIAYYESDENSRLWRWDMNTNEKNLIMDLNWNEGDTIYIDQDELKEYPNELPFTTVRSVSYTTDNRKVFETNLQLRIDDKYFNLKYIEGVGPNISIFLLEPYGFFWKMPNLLLCAYKDDIQTYINTEAGGECTYKKPDSNPEKKHKNQVAITLQLNELILDFDDTFSGKVCLISHEGKVVKKMSVNRKQKSVNTADLPDGFYIVQVTDDSGRFCIHKKITKSGLK